MDELFTAMERIGQVHPFAKGMGIAAPQIGIARAAAVVQSPGDAPAVTGGSCRQMQPEVATNKMAANTSRSPTRRRPPLCGRRGASGDASWNSSHRPSGNQTLNHPHT